MLLEVIPILLPEPVPTGVSNGRVVVAVCVIVEAPLVGKTGAENVVVPPIGEHWPA